MQLWTCFMKMHTLAINEPLLFYVSQRCTFPQSNQCGQIQVPSPEVAFPCKQIHYGCSLCVLKIKLAKPSLKLLKVSVNSTFNTLGEHLDWSAAPRLETWHKIDQGSLSCKSMNFQEIHNSNKPKHKGARLQKAATKEQIQSNTKRGIQSWPGA